VQGDAKHIDRGRVREESSDYGGKRGPESEEKDLGQKFSTPHVTERGEMSGKTPR